jgi:hypothetical protein
MAASLIFRGLDKAGSRAHENNSKPRARHGLRLAPHALRRTRCLPALMDDSVAIGSAAPDQDFGHSGGLGSDGRDGRDGRDAWPNKEAARTPPRFRTRVLTLFGSRQNEAYLRYLLATWVPAGAQRELALASLDDAMYNFASNEGRAHDILQSDPMARRGALRPALDLWGEVRRLNRAFFDERMEFLRQYSPTAQDGLAADDEPYHIRMFAADSLRPPGLEHFNSEPLYEVREDQHGRHSAVERGSTLTTSRPMKHAAARPSTSELRGDEFLYGEDDAPWSGGNANRTPEQAMAEYWGDGRSASETFASGAPNGDTERVGTSYGSEATWGGAWRENEGSRFMRYETIPMWQKGGRAGYDLDIEENLGSQARELDGHVRRWDLSRVRDPRGQEYRSYGPRTGHVV